MKKQFFANVIPAMFAFAFSGLYAIVDGFFIGQRIGDVGLAAISIAFPLVALIQAVGTGIGMGGAVIIAVSRGKEELEEEHQFFGNTLTLLLVCSAVMTVGLFVICRPLLSFLGAQGDVLQAAVSYTQIIAQGILFQLFATGLTPLIRNFGGAIWAMAAMTVGFVTNIALDYWLVFVCNRGMSGAAWATILGQAVTLILCMGYLFSKCRQISATDYRLRASKVSGIVRVGLSPFGLTISPFLVVILMNKSAVVYGGEPAVAAYAVIGYVVSVVQLLLQGVGDGSQPLISYAIGQGRWEDAKAVRNMAYWFSLVVACLNVAGVLMLSGVIPSFFGASSVAKPIIHKALPAFVVGFVMLAFCRVTTSYFYAIQKNWFAYLLVYGEPVILCGMLLLVFPRIWGLDGVWISIPVTQLLLLLLALVLLYRDRRKTPSQREQ